jgi:hypothetical protein
MQRWEYIILQINHDRVRYLNDDFLGTDTWREDSCPNLYQYLNALGQEGWEIIGTLSASGFVFERLIAKRPIR